jgi:hypothetical protein
MLAITSSSPPQRMRDSGQRFGVLVSLVYRSISVSTFYAMKRFFSWLRKKPGGSAAGPHNRPDQGNQDHLDADIVMPDIYNEDLTPTESNLEILGLSVPEVEEPAGFNPYDTGVLRKKSELSNPD